MKATPATIEEVTRLLSDTPRRIAAASNELDNDQLHSRPDKKTWSANDILAHLRACADVWGETIEAMLMEDEPVLKHLSPRTWLRKTDYLELPFRESFQRFIERRTVLLNTLKGLDPGAWSRGAIIKDRHHTIFSQARRLALHESTHCEQLETVCKDLQMG
jgi:hypothetical protein